MHAFSTVFVCGVLMYIFWHFDLLYKCVSTFVKHFLIELWFFYSNSWSWRPYNYIQLWYYSSRNIYLFFYWICWGYIHSPNLHMFWMYKPTKLHLHTDLCVHHPKKKSLFVPTPNPLCPPPPASLNPFPSSCHHIVVCVYVLYVYVFG